MPEHSVNCICNVTQNCSSVLSNKKILRALEMPDIEAGKTQNYKAKDDANVEQQFLEGKKDEDLGVYRDLFSAKSKIVGQDGGVVSALLIKGFEEGLFDSAIVVLRGEGYTAQAVVANNQSEVLSAKGTKYLKVNVTKNLRELIRQGKKRVAIVCTPCEAKAARKIQQTFSEKCEITIVGLFCFEAFNSAKIREEIKNRLGVDLNGTQKIQVRQGKFTAFVDGKEYSCKVKDIDCTSEKVCHYCSDFTSEFADISVGSVGSQRGFSTVIVRSKAGEKLIKNLDVAKEAAEKEEIVRLSKFKRKRAEKNLSTTNKTK
jgi:coenzyme F420-reducing hydrogenase beta subunit